MEQRLINIEKKIAFQDQHLCELNEVLVDQQKRILELERQLGALQEQMSSGPLVKRIEDEDPPPHY